MTSGQSDLPWKCFFIIHYYSWLIFYWISLVKWIHQLFSLFFFIFITWEIIFMLQILNLLNTNSLHYICNPFINIALLHMKETFSTVLYITAYWSTIGSIYFSIKIVSPVRIFGNLGCFSTLITVPTCKVISVHMSFEHCKGLVPGLYVDILKVFCTAGSQCNSLFLTTADCCSKEKVFPPSLPIFILNSLITI